MRLRHILVLLIGAVGLGVILGGAVIAIDGLTAAPVQAQGAQQITFEQLSIAATAVPISGSILRPTASGRAENIAACTGRLETAEVRFTVDGTTPTSSVGTLLEVGEVLLLPTYHMASNLRLIRTTGTSGTLDVTCWTWPSTDVPAITVK